MATQYIWRFVLTPDSVRQLAPQLPGLCDSLERLVEYCGVWGNDFHPIPEYCDPFERIAQIAESLGIPPCGIDGGVALDSTVSEDWRSFKQVSRRQSVSLGLDLFTVVNRLIAAGYDGSPPRNAQVPVPSKQLMAQLQNLLDRFQRLETVAKSAASDTVPAAEGNPHPDDTQRALPALPSDEIPPDETARSAPIILSGPDAKIILCGKEKEPLPPAQYRVIKALVEAKANGKRLSKDDLCNRTKDEGGNQVEDPLGALKRLRKRDPDWKAIIDMAGCPGRGYSVKDCPPTHPHPPTKTQSPTHADP